MRGKGPTLVLASGSPRRRELLARLGLEFSVVTPNVDESPLPGETPRTHAMRIARDKARAVAIRRRKNPVLARLRSGTGIPILLGRTDYGGSLLDFRNQYLDCLTKRTTVIILGDARNNYSEPQTEVLRFISERCKRLIWLNPETPSLWGSGDSEMKKYLPYCSIARECTTLRHLERVVEYLLRVHAAR